jgi:hypothetical protein
MVKQLETAFPGLARGGYRITSLRDTDYNWEKSATDIRQPGAAGSTSATSPRR